MLQQKCFFFFCKKSIAFHILKELFKELNVFTQVILFFGANCASSYYLGCYYISNWKNNCHNVYKNLNKNYEL